MAWHKSLTFEHTNNVHWRHGDCNQAAAITPTFLICWNQNQGTLWTWYHYKHTSIRNNRITSHRKITTYRLSLEMNTGRNSKHTTCLCRDTEGKGTLRAQRTGFNTLDNWGHKTPTQSKRKRTGKKRLQGHGPEHCIKYTRLHPPLLNHSNKQN